jgi:hypothetical protein
LICHMQTPQSETGLHLIHSKTPIQVGTKW